MRRVRRKGGNKEKVFGCDLLEHLNASCQEIPQVLQCCSEFVEKNGIVDGIYRLSGVSSNIQKLRGEFESDGSPDLNKDVYLQDIHCVSSLCKAYFRELPNPLLTYQLYDKFAEAVAIQLEEERLIKIRDVLKELPAQHYRTLEFLMRHLVRMASFSAETNMHSRNLAIVWAPNLLRSKDIEATGFNGTAAFMEVRVQSIVVEFILTHVPQLFPEQGVSSERRKSLPSPSVMSNQEEGFFKCAPTQPVPHFGNISPGDGPLAIRPYHAIIEGTDKRKGSLKGKKWMSFFNISGRFHDPRRRHKHSAKEKERPALRPARSMDSLSTPPYPNEGVRRTAQRPPSSNMSPLVTPAAQPAPEVQASPGPIGGSEYAVTYRRGTGLVSGGAGTQGTYTSLDPEGLGVTGHETLQSRSPGLSTKVGRRAAMHITGPTMVTVPLHITSNLALGMLQGGGSDRVIHRGRDKEGGDKVEGKERGEKVERTESRGMEWKVEESGKDEEKNHQEKVTEAGEEGKTERGGGGGGGVEEESEGKKEEKKEEEEEVEEECRLKPEEVTGGQDVCREQRTKSQSSSTAAEDDVDEYMDMKGVNTAKCQPEPLQPAFDASDVLNSTELQEDDQELSGYVQDNFEFLDQMDCSVMDHMDCRSSYQVNEFSVEPPGHSDDEYEVMEQAQSPHRPAEPQTDLQPGPESQTESQPELKPHRPLSLDLHSRHTKSLSLPYMTSPVHGPEEFSSDEEAAPDDSDDEEYSSDEDESMFIKSLPCDFFLNDPDFTPDIYKQDRVTLDGDPAHESQSSEDRGPLNQDCSAWKDVTVVDAEQVGGTDTDGLEEKEITAMEEDDHRGREQLEHNRQSEATEDEEPADTQSDKEQPLTPEAATHCWDDLPPPIDDEAEMKEEEEADIFDNNHSDFPPCHGVSCAAHKDTDGISFEEFGDFSVNAAEQLREAEERGSDEVYKDIEDMCRGVFLKITEGEEDMHDEGEEEGCEIISAEKYEEKTQMQGSDVEQDSAVWAELEDVVCEVIEDEESKQVEQKEAREREGDVVKDGEEEQEEEEGEISGEKLVDKEETNKSIVEEKLSDSETQQEFREKQTNLPKTNELEEAVEGKHDIIEEAKHRDREEEKEKDMRDKERADEQRRTMPSADKQEVRGDMKESRKREQSDSSQGGVGRKLVVAKHPRVYQVKAVPVVPPKPQHCKITALTLRQQQQERERRDADRGGENTPRLPAEQDRACAGDGEDGDGTGRKEKPTPRGGERAERERRRDGEESATRDTNRNSPLSMCFDEAVAIATMRREKEKECEKEKERQRDRGNEVQ